ncbi:hypothetical protein KFK09_001297 [Dendrobium nobile]|uniref:NB-ARC domain-containing protein n=1 Tax=Dendrobium nobile TaxID=94219 RepID=A0A8T3CAG2_DENNO|nr:hypothetical protein KFK09_001297 [Dendrobium nobile]
MDANTKSELQSILRNSVASYQSFFLVLDDVWMANVWIDYLQVPVKKLSIKTSWEMLCMLLFSHGEEELAYGLKELGFQILEKCEGDPRKILFVARVLRKKEFTRNAWQDVLGSIINLLQKCRIR